MILQKDTTALENDGLKNPFPGLRSFESNESDLFFGREGQRKELLIRLSKTHFLSVIGRSGSGKSSLVRAGLLASLYGGLLGKAGSGWHIALLRPGNDPIGNLARALNEPGVLEMDVDESRDIQTLVSLRRGSRGLVDIVHQARLTQHENLLVVVDQFEEIFRYDQISDEKYANDADAFVKLLLTARRERNIYVVLTMRSEYLGECARFGDLPDAINEGQYLIPHMTREDCRKAITEPVELRRAKISRRLVNRLLNDMTVVDTRDQLPVLQHALMRIWEKWRENGDKTAELDSRHYEMIGGMSKTLDNHAEEAFAELPNESRTIAEKLFKCLTEKDADGHETRRPTKLSEIRLITGARKKELIDVIEIFRREDRSFLMPSKNVRLKSDTSIDISHESLINGWQQLRVWVEDQADSARIYRQLAENAIIYPEEGPLAKFRLQNALDWRDQKKPNRVWARRYHARFYPLLEPSVRGKARDKKIFNLAIDFLDSSQRVRDDLEKATKDRSRRETKRAWQFAAMGGAAAIVIFLLLVTAVLLSIRNVRYVGETQKLNLQNYRTTMNLAQQASQNGKWGETNQFLNKLPLPGVEDLRGLDWYYLWAASHDERETLPAHSGEVTSVAFSPDGQIIATGSEDQKVILWDARTLTKLRELNGHRAPVLSVAFAPDGIVLATGSADGRVKIWNTTTGEEKNSLPPKEDFSDVPIVRSVAFAPVGDKLVIGRDNGSVQIWNMNGSPIETKNYHSEYVSSVAFFPNGTTIVSGSADGTVKLWDLKTGQTTDLKPNEPNTPNPEDRKVLSVAVSPDGNTIAAGMQEGLIKLWDTVSLKEKSILTPRNIAAVLCLTFAGNNTLISGNGDATIKPWDLTGPTELRTLKGHYERISAIAVSSDGKTIVTGSADTTAKLWDLSAPEETIKFSGPAKRVTLVAFHPSAKGRIIAGSYEDGAMKRWDINTLQELPALVEHSQTSVVPVAFSPDGQKVASEGEDKTMKLWDLSTGQLITTLPGHTDDVSSVAFSPDGKTLAIGSLDKTVKLWDLSAGRELVVPFNHSGEVWSIAFSLDGKTIAAGGDDGTIKAWDTHTGKKLWEQVNPAGGVNVLAPLASAPDGKLLVSAVLALAFSSDGKLLASGSADGIARLWDANNGTPLTTLIGHYDAVLSVAFSPNIVNQRLVTAGVDGNVKFWDTNTNPNEPVRRQELATLKSGDDKPPVGLWSLALSSDGKMLAIGREDGLVEIWRAASDDQVGKQRVTLKR